VNRPGTDRKERLQHQLKLQSIQIERVLQRHDVSAQVAGGSVQPRAIIFDLQSQLSLGLERLRGLQQDLMLALGVANVNLQQENGRFHIQVARPEDPPVALLDLLEAVPELESVTAVLGLAEDGRPVLLDFVAGQLPHMLLVGEPNAGKTALLRTIAASLALTSRQSQLQLAIIDPQASVTVPLDPLLAPLDYLPHMLAPIAADLAETADLLNFLVAEMSYRRRQHTGQPVIVVLIDRADWLLEMGGESVSEAIIQLAQRGETAGIHLVLSVQTAANPLLTELLKANLPLRLVGQVADTAAARTATGLAHSQAEQLLGEGDFLVAAAGSLTHFQAAYLDDYDLHLVLDRLYQQQPPPLLALPFSARPALPAQTTDQPHAFARQETEVTLAEDDEQPDEPTDDEDDEPLAFTAW
jgi:DNA segregation ATPase FtsK/SpoIIIE-like protein